MTSTGPDLGLIDAELRITALFLDGARRKRRAHPSAENEQRVVRALEDIDRLLDHRLAAARRRPARPARPT